MELIFYAFSLVLVFAAVAVITVAQPRLCGAVPGAGVFQHRRLWVLLEAEFLAIMLVLVYVGAVMVLFLFVVMMLDINLVPMREGFIRYLPVAALVALVMAVELLMVLWAKGRFGAEMFPAPCRIQRDYSNTQELGELLYTDYLLPFEIAAVVLLVAIVAAMALTLRTRTGYQDTEPVRTGPGAARGSRPAGQDEIGKAEGAPEEPSC